MKRNPPRQPNRKIQGTGATQQAHGSDEGRVPTTTTGKGKGMFADFKENSDDEDDDIVVIGDSTRNTQMQNQSTAFKSVSSNKKSNVSDDRTQQRMQTATAPKQQGLFADFDQKSDGEDDDVMPIDDEQQQPTKFF